MGEEEKHACCPLKTCRCLHRLDATASSTATTFSLPMMLRPVLIIDPNTNPSCMLLVYTIACELSLSAIEPLIASLN
jgi:hypothetical protein